MAAQRISESACDLFLQTFDLVVSKLDHLARMQVDEMVMVFAFGVFEPRFAVLEFKSLQNSEFFKKLYGAVDRGDRNLRINLQRAAVKLFNVRMVVGILPKPG